MGRQRKAGCKPIVRKRDLHSDSSDEDYMVEEDELEDQSDELDSLVGEASEEEHFGNFDDEEDEEDEEFQVRRVTKPRSRKAYSEETRSKIHQRTKRKRSTNDDEEYVEEDQTAKRKRSTNVDDEDVEYDEDEEDEDYEDYDEDDEEFTPDELDFLDEEEDIPSAKKKNTRKSKTHLKKGGSVKSRKRNSGRNLVKKPPKKKRKNNGSLRRKARSADDEDFWEGSSTRKGKSKTTSLQGRKRVNADFDSDFMSSGPSDYEFTVSEEEREQVREAKEFCGNFTDNSRNSKRAQEDVALPQPKKLPGRKGKEKEAVSKNDMGKHVCGICFTEEGKSTVRGTLSCCSHFFCFACIMEWSKVETRCPLCKQRFIRISKPVKCGSGNVVIPVPERDQVYQPSEEELRNYLDPYENVLCTECLQGGDDALMLLCDLCDSPAHTYCVGLGHEVPEGNWYCEGCRPVPLASANSHAQDVTPTRTNIAASEEFSNYRNMAEIDLNVTIPETPVSEGSTFLPSPRYPGANNQASSPVLGSGVSTLSGRRRIHRGIHHLLSGNRMSQFSARDDRTSNFDPRGESFCSRVGVDTATQEARIPDVGTSRNTSYVDRLTNNGVRSGQSLNVFPRRMSQTGIELLQYPVPMDSLAHVRTQLVGHDGPYIGINPRSGLQRGSSRSAIGCDSGLPPLHNGQSDYSSIVKQQVNPLVKNHLKSLARDMDLSYNTFKDISRGSTQTVLAACGLEHCSSDVYKVQPPHCFHSEGQLVGEQMSLMKDCCTSCFDNFVKEVVRTVMDIRVPKWLGFRH